MPELPDVAVFGRYFDDNAVDQRIEAVEGDASVLEGITLAQLAEALAGQSFSATCRHGKYLFAPVTNGQWLILHFGMTGYLKYFRDTADRPPHIRLQIDFANGGHLGYDCLRKLGRIRLGADMADFVREMQLGPDALSDDLSLDIFKQRLARSRGAVKTALMNQSILAGIGNVYADEILYHAGLHPKRKTGQLADAELKRLYEQMRAVFSQAISAGADAERMPENFLLKQRGQIATCSICGGSIEKISISGRNGYYCPHCQA